MVADPARVVAVIIRTCSDMSAMRAA